VHILDKCTNARHKQATDVKLSHQQSTKVESRCCNDAGT